MTCCPDTLEFTGADPKIVRWTAVRGDTTSLRIEFWNPDEVTPFDTDGWVYTSSTYNSRGDILDELSVVPGIGYVDIVADSATTETWGTGRTSIVAELAFDLQIEIGDLVWTPVLGTIVVLGDVTGGILS